MKFSPYYLSIPVSSALLFLTFVSDLGLGQSDEVAFFEKKIRPVLLDACIDCHGQDNAEGKLRLDSAAGWKRGGERGPAIVPGNPTASLLFQAITNHDESLKMPPPDSGFELSKRQIADFEKWIREGAVDPRQGKFIREIDRKAETHWAFQSLPDHFPDFAGKHPIDYFVENNMNKAGLVPVDRAEPETLVRRACFDLVGLPPTPDQISLGIRKFDELVNQLLDSPQYGERWGRHWLDVARYSDAKDGVLMYGNARIRPFAYTYRDYVIRAFNQDLPFDQFVWQQIAADQMELGEQSPALAALGFLTLGRMFDLNPHDVIDDQIDVVSRGILGLTASCARCHDHKFDPIPTADYYSLYGVFASMIEPLDRPRISAVLANGKAFEKELQSKLDQIRSLSKSHYERTLQTARDKTTEYLVHIATTEPDYAETAIFFKSLIPGQLRPQIVHRWRLLLERRAHAKDRLFAPWFDLNQRYQRFQAMAAALDSNKKNSKETIQSSFLAAEENRIGTLLSRWKELRVPAELTKQLETADPFHPADIARAYGSVLGSLQDQIAEARRQHDLLGSRARALSANSFDLADIVAGGHGFGSGLRGRGIHPATGKPTTGKSGFVSIPKHDILIPTNSHPLVDGIFVPKSGNAIISSTGLRIENLGITSGQTWDFFKFDVSSGSSESRIDNVDYSVEPHSVLAMHANKGITFDLNEFRKIKPFSDGRFRAILGNSGQAGKSQIDFQVYLDGKLAEDIRDFASQSPGHHLDIPFSKTNRFLTLIAMEGKLGISHDQVILGNPRVEVSQPASADSETVKRLAKLKSSQKQLSAQIESLTSQLKNNSFYKLLTSESGPIWFPEEEVEYYLSRQDRDRYRGLLNEVDAIAVRHRGAADRAMVVRDRAQLVSPVIFQRGDPGSPGNPVPRKSLSVLKSDKDSFERGSGRLELAKSLTQEGQFLTARVWVNRVWMHHFGEPLVSSPSDFGLQTRKPVQSELLDYLAVSLIRNQWRTKPLHRLIMSSKTYQRSSVLGRHLLWEDQSQKDPENQYLWKANRRRLDLEQMRDAMLFVTGNLDLTMFGRPEFLTDSGNKRRTIYAFVERQNLPTIIQAFDSANADTSTARRPNTSVPQQALYMLNSDFVIARSKELASKVAHLKTMKDCIAGLYQILFQRDPSKQELKAILDRFSRNELETVAHLLLMSNEFMFID